MASLLIPALSHCAALPKKSDISPKEQKELNSQLMDALSSSVFFNHLAVHTALINGADPNASPFTHESQLTNQSPLSRALETKQFYAVSALIQAGADLEAPVSLSNPLTPLHWLCSELSCRELLHPVVPGIDFPCTLMLSRLIYAGADLNAPGTTGNTPLSDAVSRIFGLRPSQFPMLYEIIEKLITLGADLNIKNDHGLTPLMDAVRLDTPKVVKLLVHAGADATLPDNAGQDITSYATNPDMLQIIQQALRDQERLRQIRINRILRSKEPIEKTLKTTHTYLLNGPLPTASLGKIFLSYATKINSYRVEYAQTTANEARKTQQQRAEKTRIAAMEWQAAQRARRKADTRAQQEAKRTCIIA